MDSLMRTALAAQDMFPVIRLIEELETTLTQFQAELAEAGRDRDSYKFAMEQLTNQVSEARQTKEVAIVNAAIEVRLLDMGAYFEASPYHAVERLRMAVEQFLYKPISGGRS